MQSLDIELNDEEILEKLSQDYDKPFCPPGDIEETIPKDYPSLDTNVDEHEWYDSGATISSAADIITNYAVLKYSQPTRSRPLSLRRIKFNRARKALV